MGKSRADIQRAYRERKKQTEGKIFLQKERERVKKYYIPSQELTRSEKKKRNEIKLISNRKSRERKKQLLSKQPLVLKFDFPNRGKGGKTRVRNTITNQSIKIRSLRQRLNNFRNKYYSLRRKIQRDVERIDPETANTPRKRSMNELLEAGVDLFKAAKLRKTLLMAYTVNEEIKSALKTKDKKVKRAVEVVVGSKILRKYRLIRHVSNEFGLCRNKMADVKDKVLKQGRRIRALKEDGKYREMIVDFMERCDNSTTHPNKQEVKTVDGVLKPKRFLNDYMDNLYEKFLLENNEAKISRSSFIRCRPPYILPVSFSSRRTCLCIKHQNMTLMLKVLQTSQAMMADTKNADAFFNKYTNDEILHMADGLDMTQIKFSTWKRVDIGGGKKKVSLVTIELSKQEFKTVFIESIEKFREHVALVTTQYTEIKNLKDTLPTGQLIAQMDFSENYTCASMEEVQSAYWNQSMVTIHPVVVYYKENGKLMHKSFAFISDELSHTASSVYAFIKELIPVLKDIVPFMSFLHYISDSPTSQYRNKFIFGMIANHKHLFGIPASWQFFEAGHGKGPCDGVGAVVKRMADGAVKREKQIIQDAQSFYSWAKSSNGCAVKFIFVSKAQCAVADSEIRAQKLKPVKGTLSLHSVFALDEYKVAIRRASCFCNHCFKDGVLQMSCAGWEEHTVRTNGNEILHQIDADIPQGDGVIVETQEQMVEVGDHVAAIYEDENGTGKSWYIGKVLEIDDSDDEIYVSFMQMSEVRGQITFRWPQSADEIWIKRADVFYIVDEPVPNGRSKRAFKIQNIEEIKSLFVNLKF